MIGHPIDRSHRRERFGLERQERHRKQFGKNDEIRTIIGSDVDEIFDVPHELGEILNGTGLQLNRCQPYALDVARNAECRGLVRVDVGIAPHHVRRKAVRCLVHRQIVGQHANGRKSVRQLKTDHLVAQLAGTNGVKIGVGSGDL